MCPGLDFLSYYCLHLIWQVDRHINSENNTALHIAASYGSLRVTKTLLDLGADVYAEDQHSYTPIHYAARKNHIDCLKMLLNFETDKTLRNETSYSEPLLITAAKYDAKDVAAWLLESGESTDVTDKEGLTPLHYAAINGSRSITLLLLKRGADVNSKDKNYLTPLHYAALKRHTDIAIILSAWKADLHAETKGRLTPLHLVTTEDELHFLKALACNGGNIPIPVVNKQRDYPIHTSATYGNENILQWIIDNGMSVNISNAAGYTPLLNVARVGNSALARKLLVRGADVNVKVSREDTRTSLHAACLSGNVDVARLLLENGADPNSCTSTDKRTPLHWAAQLGHLEMTKLLVSFKANISARDKFGFTPRHLAVEKRHDKIMEFLAVMSVTKRHKSDVS